VHFNSVLDFVAGSGFVNMTHFITVGTMDHNMASQYMFFSRVPFYLAISAFFMASLSVNVSSVCNT